MIKPVKMPIVTPGKKTKEIRQKPSRENSEVKTAMPGHRPGKRLETALSLLPFAFCLLPYSI
jgi:hypothetical protein